MEGSGGGTVQTVIDKITQGLEQCQGYFWTIAGVGVAILIAFIIWKVLRKGMNKAS